MAGRVVSDTRLHESPAIAGFTASTGAAPDWFRIRGTGGFFCLNDLAVQFQTSGGSPDPCMRITVITNQETRSCTATGSGFCAFDDVDFDDDTDVFFRVERICAVPVGGEVSYTIRGHM